MRFLDFIFLIMQPSINQTSHLYMRSNQSLTFNCCLLLSISLYSFALSAQQEVVNLDKLIEPSLLIEDLQLLQKNWDELHGAMYVYNSKAVIDAKFKEIEASIDEPMSSMDFYRKICPILKLIGNGHTHVVPSAEAYTSLRTDMTLLPFDLYLDKEKVYILRNNSENLELKPGDLLHSINGVEAYEVIVEITNNLTRDGINMTGPLRRATSRFNQFYAFMFGANENYQCEISTEGGAINNLSIKGLTNPVIKKNKLERYGPMKSWTELKEPAYTLEIVQGTAIMTLRTFSQKEIKKYNKTKSKKWFRNAFAKINDQKVEKLIIDLRDNGGGDESPTIELFSHLYDQPFQFYKDVYLQKRKIPNGKDYEENVFGINLIAPFLTKKQGDSYVLKSKGLKEYQPAKEQYAGEVIVLTDDGSFSATGEMTAIIKEHNRATFIGEEPSGNPNQNTSGVMLILNLPHSGIRAIVPIVVFEMNVSFENTGRGVIPDYEIRNSIEDEIKGRDAVLEFARELGVSSK